jgi:hypothetical protein
VIELPANDLGMAKRAEFNTGNDTQRPSGESPRRRRLDLTTTGRPISQVTLLS